MSVFLSVSFSMVETDRAEDWWGLCSSLITGLWGSSIAIASIYGHAVFVVYFFPILYYTAQMYYHSQVLYFFHLALDAAALGSQCCPLCEVRVNSNTR